MSYENAMESHPVYSDEYSKVYILSDNGSTTLIRIDMTNLCCITRAFDEVGIALANLKHPSCIVIARHVTDSTLNPPSLGDMSTIIACMAKHSSMINQSVKRVIVQGMIDDPAQLARDLFVSLAKPTFDLVLSRSNSETDALIHNAVA